MIEEPKARAYEPSKWCKGEHCDGPGDAFTFRHQACMPLNGRVQCIDHCIHHVVAALNAGGVRTVASCCGHGIRPGRIDLEDGRTLIVVERPCMSGWPEVEWSARPNVDDPDAPNP